MGFDSDYRESYTPMCATPIFTIAGDDGQKMKLWCIYTMKFYLDVKKSEIKKFAAKWMD